MQQTSLLAYQEVEPHLSERQAAVLEIIEDHASVNNREIADYLSWPINCVTPRVLELRRLGKVESAFVGKDVTGRNVHFWRATA